MEWINKLKYNYKQGNFAVKLIYINTAIYILTILLNWVSKAQWIEQYFGLYSLDSLLYHPWELFSYMFLHANALHLLLNMFMLYIVANFYFRYFNENSFKVFYFVGGIVGGLFYLIFESFSHSYSALIGASAAIYSVFFAMVSYQPNMEVRLMFIKTPIKFLYLAIGLLILGFLINPDNTGGNISHLGGALFGFFYMKQFERGNDFLGSLKVYLSKLFKKRSPLKKTSSKKQKTPPRDDYDYNEWKVNNEQKVNSILDKISRSGYNSLTKEEKEFLFQQGKK